LPATSRSPPAPIALSVSTRFELLTVVWTSSSRPDTFSAFASLSAVNVRGPQLWYGEAVSYGSDTETRYGIGAPFQMSALAAVRPPDDEKKYVVAILPP
jgi:hypothetical protein